MASSHRNVFAMLITLNLIIFISSYRESYVIYFREGRDKVPVTVEMDLREKVAFLNIINAQSRRSQTVSLYDYSTNMIAFKDFEKNSCYLEKMSDASFVYERRLVKSLRDQVLLDQADVLYIEEPPLSRREVLNIGGMKILNFCGRTSMYLIFDSPPQNQRRSKRSTIPRAGNVQKTYSHHEHRSVNYARFGHETTSYTQPQGSSKFSHIDPGIWPINNNNSKPSAFQLAAIRHLKRRDRNNRLRTFDSNHYNPANGNDALYGSGSSSAGQINTKIQSGFPGFPGFDAGGQFALTHADGLGHGIGSGYTNTNAGQHHFVPQSQTQYHQQQGQLGVDQIYLPVLPNNGQQYFHASGSQGYNQKVPPINSGGLGHFNPHTYQHRPHPIDGAQRTVETGLSSQSRVELGKDEFQAGASSQNAFGTDSSRTQVQGSGSPEGKFEAQAESSSSFGSSRSHTQGSKDGAQSGSTSELQNIGQSETRTELDYNRSKAEAIALTSSQIGSISSHSQGGNGGGRASSKAKGPGETASSARVGFGPEESQIDSFLGKAEASAQGGVRDGQSRTEVTGDHRGSVYTAEASGSYGQPDSHQGPIAMALPGNGQSGQFPPSSQQSSLGHTQNRENSQRVYPSFIHSHQFYPGYQHLQHPLTSHVGLPQNYQQTLPQQPIQQNSYPSQSFGSDISSSQYVPTYYHPKPQHQQNPVLPINNFQINPKEIKPLTLRPGFYHQPTHIQQRTESHSQPKNPPFQQPSGMYLSRDKSPLIQQPHLAPQSHIRPNIGLPKPVFQLVTPQSVPAVNGFRTKVVTFHVQSKGSFLPTPPMLVDNGSKYRHQLNQQQQDGQYKQVHTHPLQNHGIQNQQAFTKHFSSHQLQPALTYPTFSPQTPLSETKPDQSKCPCFHGYRIMKTVKICKVCF